MPGNTMAVRIELASRLLASTIYCYLSMESTTVAGSGTKANIPYGRMEDEYCLEDSCKSVKAVHRFDRAGSLLLQFKVDIGPLLHVVDLLAPNVVGKNAHTTHMQVDRRTPICPLRRLC